MGTNDIQDLKKTIEELTGVLKAGMREGKFGGAPSNGYGNRNNNGGGEDKYSDVKANTFADFATKGEASKIKQASAKEKDQLAKEKRNREQAENIRKQAEKIKDKDKQKKKFAEAEKYEQRANANKKAAGEAKSAKGAAKGAAAAAIAGELNGLVNSIFSIVNKEIEKDRARLQATTTLVQNSITTSAKTLGAAAKIGAANVTGSIMDTAYQSLDSMFEIGQTYYMKSLSNDIAIRQREVEIKKQTIEQVNEGVNAVAGIANLCGSYGMIIGATLNFVGNLGTQAAQREIMMEQLNIEKEKARNDAIEQVLTEAHNMVKNMQDMAKEVDKLTLKISDISYKNLRSFGLSAQEMQSEFHSNVNSLNVIMANMNMGIEEYYKMQRGFNEASGGTTRVLGTEETKRIGGLGYRMGISPEETSQLLGNMNIFNIGIEKGSDMMYEMAKTANKMGLDANKFAKNLQKDLKYAEKYSFKGGMEGLMKMSQWAQKMKVDMGSLMNMVEHFRTGDMSNLITSAAKLNVLGGNAALYSDPLSIMYDTWANPQGMADRAKNMLKGFGTFNRKTGEVTFDSINENMRIKQIAEGMNISEEEARKIAIQGKKEDELKRIYGNKFGDKMDGIIQHAQWNGKEWTINVRDKKYEGGRRTVSLNDLNQNSPELQNIFPEDKQDTLIYYVEGIFDRLSIFERTESTEKRSVGITAAAEGAENVETTYMDLIALREKGVADALENYISCINTTHTYMIKAQEDLNNLNAQETLPNLYEQLAKFQNEQFKKSIEELTGENGLFKLMAQDIYQALDIISAQFDTDMDKTDKLTNAQVKELIQKDKKDELSNEEAQLLDNFLKYHGVKGMNNAEQKKAIAKGNIEWNEEKGGFFDKQGRALKMEKTSAMNDNFNRTQQNLRSLEAEKWKDYATSYGIAVATGGWGLPAAIANTATAGISEGTGNTGGGLINRIFGKSKKANDLIISPKHGIWRTDPDDTIIASKPGGSIDRSAQKNGGAVDNLNITVNGTLTLSTGNQKIDLMELVRNDANALRSLTEKILLEASSNKYGGRHTFNANRYTI